MPEPAVRRSRVAIPRVPYVVLFALAGNIATLLLAIAITTHVQRVTEHKFCDLFLSLTDAPAPTTDRGRITAIKIENLSRSLGCPGKLSGETK